MPGCSPCLRRLGLATLCAVTLLAGGCGGEALEPWHDEYLDAEFRVEDLDEVQSFSDYLALEERLFTQLEKQVYDQVPTGPDFGLVRYSKGSRADPTSYARNWNRSFEMAVENPLGGVLLLHGMSDAPYSLRALGQALNARGYWVIGLRMPGHGTAPSGLLRITWKDMAAAVELAARHLSERTAAAPLHLVGYSTGAPLALNYALDALENGSGEVPTSLVLLSPAIGLSLGAGFASWKRALSNVPGLERQAWLDIQPEFDPYKYNSFATNAGAVVYNLTQRVASRIAARADAGAEPVLPPVLAFKSTVDATVSTKAVVDSLLRRLRPGRHELVLYDVNRVARITSVLIADPGPLTNQIMEDATLPCTVTLITNQNPESAQVVARRKEPFSNGLAAVESLDVSWPRDVLSLSHIALPFPPDDPLYGRERSSDDSLFLGQQSIQGEKGLMRIPASYFQRLHRNPFYDYQLERTVAWMAAAADSAAASR